MRRPLFRLAAVLALVLAFTGIASFEALFAPDAVLLERWTAHDPASKAGIDHGPWDRFLAAYVTKNTDGVNLMTYGRVGEADAQALDAYIGGLAAVPISRHTRPRQLAYWINLYNALTVKLILDHYPVDSIRDIAPSLFSFGPWDEDLIQVEGQPLSLNDIEHGILRPIWRDARIHYAVNCAAIGCPNLLRRAFRADTAEELLEMAAHANVNHPRGFHFDGDSLIVSSIYVWYQEDFGDSDLGVIAHLNRYAGPGTAARLERAKRLYGHAYEWGLNGGP
jgi:hypothetical protein